ncbi:MAG: metalloregulator ArsR/SmtB family transcription factor [Candidatus Nanohaloarchaea archaeon]|nr:metalloregulator ArsR/SmtB family transcription factor [Candidatus Nanohaloarchaea archaeon]
MIAEMEEEAVHQAADMFSMLGNKTRLNILLLLADGEQCVHDIADALDAELSNISHHLRKMRDNELVTYRKEGRHKYYTLADDHVVKIITAGADHAEE